ncbi:MAG: hypothetical protein LQ339_001033 [Xanthoria mediterranea]|nr:MAG: hypothetical protein LQ339_001033 [Xanthoria mediterranea]
MVVRQSRGWSHSLVSWLILLLCLITTTYASLGDRLPEFRDCVSICIEQNCGRGNAVIPVYLRLLFWTCPSNCDHTCQHIITDQRVARDPPMLDPVVQYHGKWPFLRILGVQEPCSVLFSLLNLLAHRRGMSQIKELIPAKYPLRKYYVFFGYVGMASWVFSMIFHTRDFNATEKLDYFAAGASVLYGLYYTPIRIFRLDQRKPPAKATLLRLWTLICASMYVAHISYLTLWRWDYTYNMAVNVAVGVVQNILWSWFSVKRYQKLKKPWAAWPGMIVAWIVLAMSLELLDFAPVRGLLDAHSLWHLGTVGPTIWWYNFLVRDAQQDIAGERLKA